MKVNKIYVLLLSSLLAIITCGIVRHYNTNQKKESIQWVMHTHEVLQQTLDLLSTLKDAEAGQRGYLLTRDTLYLVSYLISINQIDDKLAKLTALSTHNAPQQKIIIDKLAPLIDIKSDFMIQTVGLMRQGHADSALSIIDTDLGLLTMNQIRDIGNEIIAAEQNMLKDRSEKLNRIHFLSDITLYGGLLFIGFILILSMQIIHRKRAENRVLIQALEHHNQHLESEVNKRTQEITAKNQELIQLDEEKNRFLGIAAHDLRSPLSAINGFCYLFRMKDSNLDDEQKKWVEYIANTSDRMRHLINNLLDINRIEERRFTVNSEEVNLMPLLAEAVVGYQKVAEQKRIHVRLKTNTQMLSLMTDKHHLLQIMDNLVSNAIKFSPHGSNIYIKVLQSDEKVKIEVKDEGPGIDQEESSLLFRKFQRLSNTPTGGESSTGLGLYITKELVALLGGEIRYNSTKNKGTTFILEFPVAVSCEKVQALV
jgi:signal transduction histidine kinase